MNKQYYYGIIFWNEETDEEIFTFIKAESFFDAEKVSKHKLINKPWIEGVLHFIGESNIGRDTNYDVSLFDFVEKE
jgi:hypothetical protein